MIRAAQAMIVGLFLGLILGAYLWDHRNAMYVSAPRSAPVADSPGFKELARTEAPTVIRRPATASPVPGRITPSPTIGKRPASTEEPETAASLSGVASFVAPSYGAGYLALPDGPGHLVTICGPAACITRTSNDAGPDKAMQRAGRVADLSFRDFGIVCGCDPWVVGLVRVTVEIRP